MFPARLALILILLTALPAAAVTLEGRSLRITGEKDRDFEVTAPAGAKAGQNVLIVRPTDDDDPEVIANGKLRGGPRWRIEVDWEHLKKRPEPGDYAVLLGEPKKFPDPPGKLSSSPTDFTMEKAPPVEPGYIRLGLTRWSAKLSSGNPDPSNRADSLKNIGRYDMTGFELEWFLDFLPNYGLLLGKSSQGVPVKTYARESVAAESDRTDLRFLYRNTKIGRRSRWMLGLATRMDHFTTENPDEWILSSSATLIGVGASFAYEPGEALLVSRRSTMRWHSAGIGLTYFPLVTASDAAVRRGESSGGSVADELRVFSEWSFYLPWMPYLKRYFLRLDYVIENDRFKFHGATKNDGNFYDIPEGGTYDEKRQGLLLTVGWRFEDNIGKIFKPRN